MTTEDMTKKLDLIANEILNMTKKARFGCKRNTK